MTTNKNEWGHVERLVFPPHSLLDNISEIILDRHVEALPDLSGIVVIIPLRAAAGLKRALMLAAAERGTPTLIQPKMLTLSDLASNVPIDLALNSELQRGLEIFHALKSQRWFAAADTMSISAELLTLCNELSANRVSLPLELSGYTQALARHYRYSDKNNTDLSFEAQLTFDIWRTMAAPGANSVDQQTRYAMQLAQLASTADVPLYVVGSTQLQLVEQQFLANYQGAVTTFDDAMETVTQEQDAENDRARLLNFAWRGAPRSVLSEAPEQYPLPSKAETDIQLYPAHDIEDEAHFAAETIRQWLRDGKREIAIVALDRLSARRLRALLERDDILASDEIGWPYSTTSCGTVIMRWLDALQDDFYFSTLIDLIKSPFIFADLSMAWGRSRLKSAVLLIERTSRRHGIISGVDHLRELLLQNVKQNGDSAQDAIQLIDRLRVAKQTFIRSRQALAAWLLVLNESLIALGVREGLANDNAGVGLLEYLDQWRDELQQSNVKLVWSEWMQWLRSQFEAIRFRDSAIVSPIVMTSLAATRYRQFDAVLILGATAKNLPGNSSSGIFFNQSVRSALGLPTRHDAAVTITQDLFGLLNRSDDVMVSWQTQSAGEAQLPSPWVSSLQLCHEALFGSRMYAAALPRHVGIIDHAYSAGTPNAAPIGEFEHIPPTLSASGYQSLIDCPYQFFARYRLGLREQDDISEEMEKRDYGEFVHQILFRFHSLSPILCEVNDALAESQLREVSEEIFKASLNENFVSYAWFARWLGAIPAYLAWQCAREADGWRWYKGEQKFECVLALANNKTLTLNGRVDRVDRRKNELGKTELALIDYKTQDKTLLKKRLQIAGEDVQLASYTALVRNAAPALAVSEAAFLAINVSDVKSVPLATPMDDAVRATTRLVEIYSSFVNDDKTRLPAQGTQEVCAYCEMRGLCRRDYWPTET